MDYLFIIGVIFGLLLLYLIIGIINNRKERNEILSTMDEFQRNLKNKKQ